MILQQSLTIILFFENHYIDLYIGNSLNFYKRVENKGITQRNISRMSDVYEERLPNQIMYWLINYA